MPTPRPATRRVSRSDSILLQAYNAGSSDGVLVVDRRGRIASFNPRFVELWGIPKRIVRTRSDEKAIRSVLGKLVDPQGFLARVQYLYEHPNERSREELALKDGRSFERHSAPIHNTAGECYGRVWIFRDITERKREEALRQEAERLRSHREFVANVSHELRTPLTAIEGFTETLINGGVDDLRNRAGFLKTIVTHSRRLRRLIDSLLDIAHLEAGKTTQASKTLALSDYLGQFLKDLKPVFRRKEISVQNRAQPGLEVSIDEHDLSRILGNLIDNAVKFSPRGGRIRLSVRRDGQSALVSIQDEGIGIAREDLPHIFERFRRSTTARRHNIHGTGLGLSLVKQLVASSGGSISVKSREGRGTRFEIALPLDRAPGTPKESARG